VKALIVGGTGFIGSHIVKDLLSKDIEVRVLIRGKKNINDLPDKRIEYKYGSISDIDSLREHTKDVDVVYSAFGLLGQWGVPDQMYWDVNTMGVKNLLESCLNCGIKRFIHISSAGVLGPLPNGVVAEESFPYNPSNIYEATKCEAEKEILKYNRNNGIPTTIIRPEFVYGPGDTHVLGLFKAIRNRRFLLLGNGKSLLHPTYIDDLIQGIRLCSENESAIDRIFLITGDKPIPVKELAKTIAEESGVRLPKIEIPLFFANTIARIFEFGSRFLNFEPLLTRSRVNFFIENRAFSCQKARDELGYVPKVDFREGVRKTISWYRENNYL
jgi:nucleoside-diphosphate-sugar epimerase